MPRKKRCQIAWGKSLALARVHKAYDDSFKAKNKSSKQTPKIELSKESCDNNSDQKQQPNSSIMVGTQKAKPTGRRLFTITAFDAAINRAIQHTKYCQNSELQTINENRDGLETNLIVKCITCNKIIKLINDTYDCTQPSNEAAVWAANSNGAGFSVIDNIMTVLEIPFMSFNKYAERQRKYHKQLETISADIIRQNGAEERKKAVELGMIDSNGIAYTDVEGDCAWARRSFLNRGLSKAGSVVLIGKLTKKPLFTAVRISSCYVCKVFPSKVHDCYKNWEGTASAMEADMVFEGFQKSMSMHSLRYQSYLGDGDSSVYAKIRTVYQTPEFGNQLVQKVECKNHAIRCMNKNLKNLLTQTAYPIAHRKILGDVIHRIGKVCVYAIVLNAENQETSVQTNYLTLSKDIRNSLDHALGDHTCCSAYLCNNGKLEVPKRYQKDNYDLQKHELPNQKGGLNSISLKHTSLYKQCQTIIDRLANLSSSLISDTTTNLSESYFSQWAKFLQGKRTNCVNRGTYHLKSLQTMLANRCGTGWTGEALKMVTGKSPAMIIKRKYAQGIRRRASNNKRLRKTRRVLFPSKSVVPKFFSKTKAFISNTDYGPGAHKPDQENEILIASKHAYLADLAVKDKEEQWQIHRNTIGQFKNAEYVKRKENMITASIAGDLNGLRNSTSNRAWLDKIIYRYKTDVTSKQTLWGVDHEPVARMKYSEAKGVIVEDSGLFVSLENPLLGASPDGLVDDDGIIEIKCPFIERYQDVGAVAKRSQSKFMNYDSATNSYSLIRSHKYYHQIVMQLHVTGRKWCDFVVWTQGSVDNIGVPKSKNGEILVERIVRDSNTRVLWEKMKKKFVNFIMEDILPEVIDSRLARNMEFKQPEYRINAINEASKKTPRKKKNPNVKPAGVNKLLIMKC